MAKTSMRKNAEYENYFQELGNSPNKIFDSMKDVFMFAAAVGYKYNENVPFQKAGGENIALRFFDDDDNKIIDLIALAVTQQIDILLSGEEYVDKKLKLIENLANGGMGVMVNAFCKPVIDTSELYKFVESFEDGSGNKPKVDIASFLQGAMGSL